MSLRHSWKGFLKLSLVTIPVKAFPAISSANDIHLNQLHAECHSRIRYRKTCPLHGEVAGEEIISGYEYAQSQYVVIDPAELDKLRTAADKAITIDAFVAAGSLDPLYANGKTHYLVPDGAVAHKSYAVLWQGMRQEKRHAVAQVVLHSKEQLVWLRPLDGLLVMTQLHYDDQVTKPTALADHFATAHVAPQELDLLRLLIEASTPETFDLAKYQDQYRTKLARLIEAKVAGQEIVAAPQTEETQVISLMAALKQSVANSSKAAAFNEGNAPAAPKPRTAKGKAARSKKVASL